MVRILDMHPRLPFGCAANRGLLYDEFGKERITIYELTDPGAASGENLRGAGGAEVCVRLHDAAALRHSERGHIARPLKPPAVQPFTCRCDLISG